MSTPILTTKLYLPIPRPNLVLRSRLIERLNEGWHQEEGFGRKLTRISAPAGFGKTTMVSAWAGTSENPSAQLLAWLSLDEGDSDPNRFVTYLVAALQTIAPDIGAGVLGLLHSPQPPPATGWLTGLVLGLSWLSNFPLFCLIHWITHNENHPI